jgi:hypothetical protein
MFVWLPILSAGRLAIFTLIGALLLVGCFAASAIASQTRQAGDVNVPGFGKVWVRIISPDGKAPTQVQLDQNVCVRTSAHPVIGNQERSGDLHVFVSCMQSLGNQIELTNASGARVDVAQIPMSRPGATTGYTRQAPASASPPSRPVVQPAPTVQNPAYAQMLDRMVSEDSRSWAVNRYRAGSIRNVTISGSGSDGTIRANFDYASGSESGWVEARVQNNKVSCVRYWDFPNQCRPVGTGMARQIEEYQRQQQAAWNALSQSEKNRILAERRRQNEISAAQEQRSSGLGLAGALMGLCPGPLGLGC